MSRGLGDVYKRQQFILIVNGMEFCGFGVSYYYRLVSLARVFFIFLFNFIYAVFMLVTAFLTHFVSYLTTYPSTVAVSCPIDALF